MLCYRSAADRDCRLYRFFSSCASSPDDDTHAARPTDSTRCTRTRRAAQGGALAIGPNASLPLRALRERRPKDREMQNSLRISALTVAALAALSFTPASYGWDLCGLFGIGGCSDCCEPCCGCDSGCGCECGCGCEPSCGC